MYVQAWEIATKPTMLDGSMELIRAMREAYQYPRVFADSIELVPQQASLRSAHASLPRAYMIRWKEKSVTDARRRVLS